MLHFSTLFLSITSTCKSSQHDSRSVFQLAKVNSNMCLYAHPSTIDIISFSYVTAFHISPFHVITFQTNRFRWLIFDVVQLTSLPLSLGKTIQSLLSINFCINHSTCSSNQIKSMSL